MPSVTTLAGRPLTVLRARLRDGREARAAHKALVRDLACYTTEDDLDDFEAILDRYGDAETADIRHILSGRRA